MTPVAPRIRHRGCVATAQEPDARRTYLDYLMELGLSAEESRATLRSFVYAEQIGVPTHGLARVASGFVRKLIERGLVEPRKEPLRASCEDGVELWDGRRCVGYYGIERIVRSVVQRHAATRTLVVHAHNLYPTGSLSQQAAELCDRGFVVYMTQRTPKRVGPPVGAGNARIATRAVVGTNPTCWGFPSRSGPHIIFDGAMSATTNGATLLSREAFERSFRVEDYVLPDGGRPARPDDVLSEGELAAIITPFGGERDYKGFGHLLPAELLHGLAAETDAIGSTTIVALRPWDLERFWNHLDRFREEVRHSLSHADGCRPRLPYERARAAADVASEEDVLRCFPPPLVTTDPTSAEGIPLSQVEVPEPAMSPAAELLSATSSGDKPCFVGASRRDQRGQLSDLGHRLVLLDLSEIASRLGEVAASQISPADVRFVVDRTVPADGSRLALYCPPGSWERATRALAGDHRVAFVVLEGADEHHAMSAADAWPGALIAVAWRPGEPPPEPSARLEAVAVVSAADTARELGRTVRELRSHLNPQIVLAATAPTDHLESVEIDSLTNACDLLLVPEGDAWCHVPGAGCELRSTVRLLLQRGERLEQHSRAAREVLKVARAARQLVSLPIADDDLVAWLTMEARGETDREFFDHWSQESYELPHLRQHKMLIDSCVAALPTPEDLVLLDIGAGTGALVHRLPHARRVDTVDLSSHMLAPLGDAGTAPRVPVRRLAVDYLTHVLPGDYDAIVAILALHHFDDTRIGPALTKAYDELKPGGLLFLGETFLDTAVLDNPRTRKNICDIYLRKVVNATEQGCTAHAVKDLQILHRVLDRDGEYMRTIHQWARLLSSAGFSLVDSEMVSPEICYGYLIARKPE